MQNLQQPDLTMTLPDESLLPSISPYMECRICLCQNDNHQFIHPCKCSGSMRFVHFKCLSTWIQRSNPGLMQSDQKRQYYPCQMCKYKIRFQRQSIKECISCQNLKIKIKQHQGLFILLVILTIICITLTLLAIVVLADPQSFNITGSFTRALIGVAVLILIALLIVLIYAFVSDYCIKTISFIRRIHNYYGHSRNIKHSISPQKTDQTMTTQTKFTGSRTTIHPEMILRQIFD